jgi:predicted nucleic acid-binding protein
VPLRLIDSSVWIAFLRPGPDVRIVKAVRRALTSGEAAIAAAVVVEVLSGIRDRDEYAAREADFRALPVVPTDGEAAYLAARIGEALAAAGKPGKTVDLLLAGAALAAGAELWSLRDEHFVNIRAIAGRSGARGVKAPHIVFLPQG